MCHTFPHCYNNDCFSFRFRASCEAHTNSSNWKNQSSRWETSLIFLVRRRYKRFAGLYKRHLILLTHLRISIERRLHSHPKIANLVLISIAHCTKHFKSQCQPIPSKLTGMDLAASTLCVPISFNSICTFTLYAESAIITWKDVCNLPKVVGPCRASFPRWYFDAFLRKCIKFAYGGCNGNMNSFRTKAECKIRCMRRRVKTRARAAVLWYGALRRRSSAYMKIYQGWTWDMAMGFITLLLRGQFPSTKTNIPNSYNIALLYHTAKGISQQSENFLQLLET